VLLSSACICWLLWWYMTQQSRPPDEGLSSWQQQWVSQQAGNSSLYVYHANPWSAFMRLFVALLPRRCL
jgi:hypothetical protein